MPSKPDNAPARKPGAHDRDALKQGVEPPSAPAPEERTYEDAQDAAFDPRGDRAPDDAKPRKDRR